MMIAYVAFVFPAECSMSCNELNELHLSHLYSLLSVKIRIGSFGHCPRTSGAAVSREGKV
jgi:hypothetical protein